MSAEQALNAYAVTLVFTNMMCQDAAAITMHRIMQSPPPGEMGGFTGVAVTLLSPEWLAAAHRIVNEGQKPGGAVLSLVPRDPDPALPAHVFGPLGQCTVCRATDGTAFGTLACPGRPYSDEVLP